MRKILFAIVTVFILSNLLRAEGTFAGYAPNTILVKFTQSALGNININTISQGVTDLPKVDALNAAYRVKTMKRLFPHYKIKFHNGQPVTLNAWYRLYFDMDVDEQAVAAEYSALTDVIVAEAVPIHKTYATANDPGIGSQWHINQSNDADIDAPEAWDLETGSSNIIVAVMDTGVRWYHKDLAGALADETDRNTIKGNMWINSAELSDTSSTVDEDGNGYNDDWVGWDFVTGNPNSFDEGDDYDVEDNDPRDHNGHGTHCAGNVGAINNNGLGVTSAGGGWGENNGQGNGVKIMALRIGWSDLWLGLFETGYVDMGFAASAFTYAADNGAKLASCSWGSSETAALADAVNYFIYGTTSPGANDPKQRLIFVAAGNDGNENAAYLNSRDDIISVAGTDENDSEYGSSNYGTWINIAAPATNIYSTYHDKNNPASDEYAALTGTSMATPIAASVTALIWSHNQSLPADTVEQKLYDSADNIEANLSDSRKGKLGAGRVNAYAAVQIAGGGGTNQAPVAVDDNAATDEDVTVEIAVLTNDSDPDNDGISVTATLDEINGVATINNSTTVFFAPDSNFYGSGSFRYVISDGNGGMDTAVVTVTVNSVNDAPQIVGLPGQVDMNTNDSTKLKMQDYAQDVDTPYEGLTWTFSTSGPEISYNYNSSTDTLTIYSTSATGDYYLYATLTDDSSASDKDTILVRVSDVSAVEQLTTLLPKEFVVEQNYPNPFNPSTTLRFGLPEAASVRVEVYNVTGQRVASMEQGALTAGFHTVQFKAGRLPSGMYYYKITAGTHTAVKKMILVK